MLEERVEPQHNISAEIGITCSYNLRGGTSGYATIAFWSEKENFIERVESSRAVSIVYGTASNTVHQLKNVVGAPQIQSYLVQHYDKTRIGSYTVWFHKERARQVLE
jgi:hypothetical protein